MIRLLNYTKLTMLYSCTKRTSSTTTGVFEMNENAKANPQLLDRLLFVPLYVYDTQQHSTSVILFHGFSMNLYYKVSR